MQGQSGLWALCYQAQNLTRCLVAVQGCDPRALLERFESTGKRVSLHLHGNSRGSVEPELAHVGGRRGECLKAFGIERSLGFEQSRVASDAPNGGCVGPLEGLLCFVK